MAIFQRVLLTTSVLMAAFSSGQSIGSDKIAFTGKARIGSEYQSNVNINAIEQASGQSDSAMLLEAELTTSWQATPQLRLDAGYSILDKNYRQANDFNTRLQLAYLDGSYMLGKHTIGANFYHANAQLNKVDFLRLNQASLYSLLHCGDTWFIRPALTFAEKTFASIHERDANTFSASTDAFWFSGSGMRFLSMGLVWEDESTQDPTFSYRAPGLRVKLSNRFTRWQFAQQLQVGAKVSQRDYQTTQRSDTHTVIDASWQLNLNPQFAIIGKMEHGDFSSTLDRADYRETRTALLLQFEF
ncbi:hypothetical protein GCM10010919_16260 [Alishewanella longhuensis]|uniref:DUF560 domain-containing protein n=1 Tax=Alishewanella longhuensis TaxID=1091037 RepID=A0ABQ3KYD0_9ALTE|nr:outer membrane beta-barrel protein [Alishewanella longhuensis]GHG67519.1 hypothetical protein GCM10010919_16260 [Alishewanella longhuensis]